MRGTPYCALRLRAEAGPHGHPFAADRQGRAGLRATDAGRVRHRTAVGPPRTDRRDQLLGVLVRRLPRGASELPGGLGAVQGPGSGLPRDRLPRLPSSARAYTRSMGGDWPNLVDPGARTALAYGVYGVPETFSIRPDGVVDYKRIGATSYDLLSNEI